MLDRKTKFRFKHFEVSHTRSSMKVGTDAVVLGAWIEARNYQFALDVGTGSGVIALMLAQRFPDLRLTGVDIHEQSVKEAKDNFENSLWNKRLEVWETAVQNIQAGQTFDLIASNPPYFNSGSTSPQLARANARHVNTLSHQELIHDSYELLSSSGSLAVIIPRDSANDFEKVAIHTGFYSWRKTHFKPRANKKPERVLLQMSKNEPTSFEETELLHYDNQGNWTEAYKNLTQEFYLRL